MIEGLQDFVKAVKLVFSRGDLSSWYWSRIKSVLGWAVLTFLIFVFIFGLIFYFLFGWLAGFPFFAGSETMSFMMGVGIGLIAIFLILILMGPLLAFIASFLMSIFGDWKNLFLILPTELKPSEKGVAWTSVFGALLKTLVLTFLLILAILISLLLPFAVIGVVILTATIVGREWALMVDEHFELNDQRPSTLGYTAGLGLLPTLLSGIPFAAIFCAPFLQIAASLRYNKNL